MPNVSRRDFLKYCGIGAGALGLSMTDLGRLGKGPCQSQRTGGYLAAGRQLHWMFGILFEPDFQFQPPDCSQCIN